MTAPPFKKSLLMLAVVLGSISGAHAASQQQYYADALTAATPADARDEFLKGSTAVTLEGFETQAVGIPPLALSLFSGAGSLTQDEFSNGAIKQGAEQNGRFNTTPNCNVATACKWWETPASFQVTLGSLKSAFGFFATDLGDLGGAISLDFWNDNTKVRSGIAVTQPTQTSGLLFFGWIDDTFSFNRVSFNLTQTNSNPARFDYIGFDDLLAGTRAAVVPPGPTPVSAPASLALVALSLGLLAVTRRRSPPVLG